MISNSDFVLTVQRQNTKTDGPTVVVSKKITKKAVQRNRIRRIVKEALRSIGFEESKLVIIVKKNIANLKTNQVKKELADLILEYAKKSR